MPDDDRSERQKAAVTDAARSGDTPSSGGRRAVRTRIAAGLLCCLGLLAFADAQRGSGSSATPEPGGAALVLPETLEPTPGPGAGATAGAGAGEPVEMTPPVATPTPDVATTAEARATAAEVAEPVIVDPGPVAGLSQVQVDNAQAIVRTGHDLGVPRRALVIAVATAMQESTLLNRASEVLPESKNYPHQGTGWDHDSVGLFQQRTSTGWGPVAKLMDPAYAAQKFFEALRRIPGWEGMRLAQAAQAVQGSAFPEHYARHEGQANQVVDAIMPVDR